MSITMSSMLGAVKVGRQNPLSAGSVFKNPAEGGLSSLREMHTSMSSVLGGQGSSQLASLDQSISQYHGIVTDNLTSRLKTLPHDVGMAKSAASIKSETVKKDGGSFDACDFINGFFDTIHDIENIVNGVIDEIEAVIGKITDIINKTIQEIMDVIEMITDKINDAIQWLQNKIQEEIEALEKLIGDIWDHSFLKSLLSGDYCTKKIAGAVMDSGVIDQAIALA